MFWWPVPGGDQECVPGNLTKAFLKNLIIYLSCSTNKRGYLPATPQISQILYTVKI